MLSIMPSWPVSECPARKMKRHFAIKLCQSRGIALTIFYSFFEFSTQVKRSMAMARFVNNGTANFGRRTEISGPPSEVIPNIWLPNEISGIVGTTGSTHSVRLIGGGNSFLDRLLTKPGNDRKCNLNGTQVHMYISPHVHAGTHLPLVCSPCMVVIL